MGLNEDEIMLEYIRKEYPSIYDEAESYCMNKEV